MRFPLIAAFAATLSSCGLFSGDGDTASAGTAVVDRVTEVLPEALGMVSSGNLVGAGVTVATAAIGGFAMWLKKRMKNSQPGEIIGGSNPVG